MFGFLIYGNIFIWNSTPWVILDVSVGVTLCVVCSAIVSIAAHAN